MQTFQSGDFRIRPATNADITAVKNIVFSVLTEYGLQPSESGKDHDLDDLEANYFQQNGFFGVLEFGTLMKAVGTFGLYRLEDDVCELRKMYLVPECRGRGAGIFMLESAMYIAKETGCVKMVLETISPLKEAISLYKKYGFREVTPKEINERVDQAFEKYLL